MEATYVVVGGGIAGASCVEALKLYTTDRVLLISESPVVKVVTDVKFHTKLAAGFNVEDRNLECGVTNAMDYVIDKVTAIDSEARIVYTSDRREIKYGKLCLCTGAAPKLLLNDKDYVIGLRDTHSVEYFQSVLGRASRVLIVGNGGIATELVYKLNDVEIVWSVRDEHISSHFLDAGAAEFVGDHLTARRPGDNLVKRFRYRGESSSKAALGPDWHSGAMFGNRDGKNVVIEYRTDVRSISKSDDVVTVELTNGKVYECDFIISATGVTPNSDLRVTDGRTFDVAQDGGIKVDWKMETNLTDIFAAGDVCTVDWTAEHWFQMRLWSQARQMGLYAAKCMHSTLERQPLLQDFCFELFTHVTSFFGFSVVLLGLYNAQGLDKKDCELLVRVTDGEEYVKLVVKNGRVVGAVLIGNSDLGEMCENLILNRIDVTDLMDDLLNPDIDIEDYFD